MKKTYLKFLILTLSFIVFFTSAQNFNQWKSRYENAAKEDLELALKTGKIAVQYFQKKGDQNSQAYFYELIAKNYQGRSMQDSALHFHFLAIDIYDKIDLLRDKAMVLNEVGRVHRKLKNNQNALQYYDEALTIFNKLNDDEGEAIILNESGVVFEQMGNHSEAQKRFRRSLMIQKKRKDSVGIGYSLEFIGYNFLLQNKLQESEEYLLKSLEIREKLKDDFALTLNYNTLAELFYKKNNWQKAEEFIVKSNQLSRKINYPDIRVANLELQIKNAQKNANFQNAFLLREQQISLKDSL